MAIDKIEFLWYNLNNEVSKKLVSGFSGLKGRRVDFPYPLNPLNPITKILIRLLKILRRFLKIKKFVSFFGVLGIGSLSWGNEVTVYPGGATYTTIQAGVDAYPVGGTVSVAAGTYTEAVYIN